MKRTATIVLGLVMASSHAYATELLKLGTPFGEAYRSKFAECDAHDTFGGKPVTRLHRCTTDPSRFDHLSQVPASSDASKAVIFESKMAHDDDGSARSCSAAHGSTSQCPTTLMLKATKEHPCKVKRPATECVPVDPDAVAYIVVPGSGKELGLSMGDYGMVVFGGKQVPVIVADSGPSNKIGEGSTRLLSRLSKDGRARTIGRGAVYVMFPGSADRRAELSPDTLPQTVEQRASGLYNAFRKANP